jgi:type IV pilus assembly protein PilX
MKSHVLHQSHQRGVSLIIVLVIMLLSSLMVLGGSRVANLNEMLAGSDSDQQRAFEAAQILLKDAELDIQNTNTNLRPENMSLSKIDNELLLNLRDAALASAATQCLNGVCINQGARTSGDPTTSFWNNPALLAAYTANGVGVRYGQWSGAAAPAAGTSNPIVAANQAWYWIELLPFSGQAPDWAQDCVPTRGSAQFLFRITALAIGRNGVPTVVQEIFVPKPEGNTRRCPA